MKSAPATFDVLETPLQRGTSLLEASAGTGKTYAIAGIFVRLVLEADLSVDQILAVTYTDAATAELRDRIRKALAAAHNAFSGRLNNDAFLTGLVKAHAKDKKEMLGRLERALACFDQAAIYTIHGFCQRVLQDRAFESGVLFDVELITDQTSILREIAGDYWRKTFYEQHPLALRFALKNQLSPEMLLKFFRQCVNHPALKFYSRAGEPPLKDLEEKLQHLFSQARDEWRRDRELIRSWFGSGATWWTSPYNNDREMDGCFALLDRCFASAEPDLESLKTLKSFCLKDLAAKAAKRAKSPAPAHRFFELCGALGEIEEDLLNAMRLDFVRFAQTELPKRKMQRKVQSFDDLLMNVYRVLQSPGGEALAQNLRNTYKAALIDEFQDTDPVQYEIFRRVFAGGQTFLYLIGDPKQAIYAFRGADIFTYMQAAGEAKHRYTLEKNWRSEAKLVQAVNTIFEQATNPFVFDRIEFSPVIAKANADKTPLVSSGEQEAPFRFWFCESEGKSVTRADGEEQIPMVVAAEIVRLLNGDTQIGERRLRPEDIAVIVPENKHAELMQDALRVVNVPSVLHTTASLFKSFEAIELRRVLMAIHQPANERRLRAALATELMGVSGPQLAGLSEMDSQKFLERFHSYLTLWLNHGFFRMFRHWLREESLRARLLAFPDGERRLTNLLHLGEVLHTAEAESRLGASGLLQWLDEQMTADTETDEEHQLRLERDDNAVRLITIHKSKGLQYGIVFCPFTWRSSEPTRRNAKEIFFHDPAANLALACDLGGRDYEVHLLFAGRERLAENVRLLYVAVTRAVHRCYFAWGKFRDAGTSAAAWLFHAPQQVAAPVLAELEATFDSLLHAQVRGGLHRLADASGGAISVEDLPVRAPEHFHPTRDAKKDSSQREFTGKIPWNWRITSFSLLSSAYTEDVPDYDDVAASEVEPEAASGIFAFPRGVRAGTCLHEILQQIDFPNAPSAAAPLIHERLRNHGLWSVENVVAVEEMLGHLMERSLLAGQPALRLARIGKNERLNELEFYFPINGVHLSRLQEHLATLRGLATIRPEGLLDLVNGFLKGFIDLVFRLDGKFYIIDWKSNWLGNRTEDYGSGAMQAEMVRHHYFLQYHIYTVALHKYLSLRLADYDFEKHFGGVFYVFLRGIDRTKPEFGIFHDRPSVKMVHRLGELLGTL